MKKIIIDTLGSDNGCEMLVKGALRAYCENPECGIVFVGDKTLIQRLISDSGCDDTNIEILHTEKFVSDSDLPTCVFKGNDEASMVKSLLRLKEDDEAVALMSAGNTGALLVGSIFRLGLVKGLQSPALATALPCKKGGLVALLDCGANTECTPSDLCRYAVMGNAFVQSYVGKENPKVALMSVGPTRHKGNALVKEAYGLIEKLPVNFVGNIEGNEMIDGDVDVIVTDGFTGNVLLKNAEAAGRAAIEIADKLGGGLPQAEEIKKEIYERFAFNDLGGATFLGTVKPVVKMHGCANSDTAYSCVKMALKLYRGSLCERIEEAVSKL